MNVKWNDKAITTRAGEELPISKLKACLLDHLPNVSGSMKVKQFPGGYSNLTYLISMGDTEYVLRDHRSEQKSSQVTTWVVNTVFYVGSNL